MNWQFNPEVTLEAIATSIGVIVAIAGGVTGFLIAVFRQSSYNRRERRERADRLVIMEILEQDLKHGLSEQAILGGFQSPGTIALRKQLGATEPSKMTIQQVSQYMRDLQWSHMVDQVGTDSYKLCCSLPYKDNIREKKQSTSKTLLATVSEEEIITTIEKHFRLSHSYDRRDILRTLLRRGHSDVVRRLSADLIAEDSEQALRTAQAMLMLLEDE
jgi:hypothetical protein